MPRKYAGQQHLNETLDLAQKLRTDSELRANIQSKTDNLHGFYRAVNLLESRALRTKTVKEAFGAKAHLPKKTLAAIKHETNLMWELWVQAYTGTKGHKLLESIGYFKEEKA